MDDASQITSNFFAGSATDAQLNSIWDCGSHALDVFMQKVKGATPGVYRAVELRGFFQRYYIHNLDLTDSFLESVGELKQVLVGGTSTQITAAEIKKIQSLIETLRGITLSLRPYMPISMNGIENKAWSDLSEDEIDGFSTALNGAAIQLAQVLESVGATYTFTQFDVLLQAVQSALPPGQDQDDQTAINSFRSHMDLIKHGKAFFVSPELDIVGAKGQWQTLLSTGGTLASMAIKGRWLLDTDRLSRQKDPHFPDETLTRGKNLQDINVIVNQFTTLLKQSIARHPNQVITFDELVSLINLIPDDVLPVSKASIISLIQPRQGQTYSLVSRVVGGTDASADGRAATGFTGKFVDHLTTAFANWYEGQRFLQTLYGRIGSLEDDLGGDLVSATIFQSAPALQLWEDVYSQNSPQWNKTTALAAKRLESAIRGTIPLYYAQLSSEVSFPVDKTRQAYTFHDLAQVNWIQMAANMVIQGYMDFNPKDPSECAQDDDNIGICEAEFQRFFDDLKPFGIEIKLFDPDGHNSAPARFRELDVFTYASNGDGHMSPFEAIEYVAFSFSAFTKAARIHDDISMLCQADQAADPKHDVLVKIKADAYGEDLIRPDCYRKHFFGNYSFYWDPMVTAEKFYGSLSVTNRDSYNHLLEVAARKYGYTDVVWVDSADSQSFVAVLQYVEATFSRYDVKRTGFINESEANVAFPVFKNVLEKIAAAETPPMI